VSNDGSVLVVEVPNAIDGGPKVRISNDSGSTWFTPATAPVSGDALRSFAMSGSGTIMTACSRTNVFVHIAKGAGATSTWGSSRASFGVIGSIGDGNLYYKPCSAMSADGAYIFWPGLRSTNGTASSGGVSTASFSAVSPNITATGSTDDVRSTVCSSSGQYVLWPGKGSTPALLYSTNYGATVTDISGSVSTALKTATNTARDYGRFAQLSNSGEWFFYGMPASSGRIYRSSDTGASLTQYTTTNANNSYVPPSTSAGGMLTVFVDSAQRLVLVTDPSMST
jgi:hypothetical protein